MSSHFSNVFSTALIMMTQDQLTLVLLLWQLLWGVTNVAILI